MKPSRLLLGLLGGLFAAAVLLGALPLLGMRLADSLMPVAWGLLLALALIAAVDALWLRRQHSPRLERVLQSAADWVQAQNQLNAYCRVQAWNP